MVTYDHEDGERVLTTIGVGHSDVGRVRDRNEDSFFVDDALGLYVVSDGMGGHAGGEMASRTAVEALVAAVRGEQELIDKVVSGDADRSELTGLMDRAVSSAAETVYQLATSPQGQSGMGCTVTALLVAGRVAAMGHVGDSRLYLLRGDGVSQLSSDHTVVAEMMRTGMGDEESLQNSPFTHVLTRAVGPQPAVQVETLGLEVLAGDRFVLCSDGFSNHLERPTDLNAAVADTDAQTLAAAVEALVATANERGGEDNITIVAIAASSEEPQPERTRNVVARFDAVRGVFMFEDLDHAMITRVISSCRVQRHEAGDVVIEIGDSAHELMVVVAGSYELVDADGTTGTLGAGEFAGITTLMKERPSKARLTAMEPSRLLRLHGADFSRLIRRRPWLGIGLLERLGRKLGGDLDRSYAQREGSDETVQIRERF